VPLASRPCRGTGTKHERQSVALQNSWDSRVKVLVRWLEDDASVSRLDSTSFRESGHLRAPVTNIGQRISQIAQWRR
jgi:hypothetical protein